MKGRRSVRYRFLFRHPKAALRTTAARSTPIAWPLARYQRARRGAARCREGWPPAPPGCGGRRPRAVGGPRRLRRTAEETWPGYGTGCRGGNALWPSVSDVSAWGNGRWGRNPPGPLNSSLYLRRKAFTQKISSFVEIVPLTSTPRNSNLKYGISKYFQTGP